MDTSKNGYSILVKFEKGKSFTHTSQPETALNPL